MIVLLCLTAAAYLWDGKQILCTEDRRTKIVYVLIFACGFLLLLVSTAEGQAALSIFD